MIKVLYVSPNGYLGGAERFVLTAAIAHKIENNIDSRILFFADGEACKEAQKFGVNCFVLKNSFRLRSPLKLFFALKEIRRLVVQYKPDVLHLTMPYSHIVLSLATLGLGIKNVWFQHGPVGGRLDQIANLFPVDMIWYNSNYLKMKHQQTWPRSTVRVQEAVISLGVNTKKGSHALFSNSVIKLGAAGRICSGKGFHNIIIALGELKKEKILKPYRFFIAGAAKSIQDREHAKELVDLVQSCNLVEEIKFLEHIENMESFYQDLDVFIHSAIVPEPFGLVVAEAMINGCLVIGSDRGGVSDFLQDGKTGITFPATSCNAIEELKSKLRGILTQEDNHGVESYREMAEKGRVFVENNNSVEKMISQMETLYIQLVRK